MKKYLKTKRAASKETAPPNNLKSYPNGNYLLSEMAKE